MTKKILQLALVLLTMYVARPAFCQNDGAATETRVAPAADQAVSGPVAKSDAYGPEWLKTVLNRGASAPVRTCSLASKNTAGVRGGRGTATVLQCRKQCGNDDLCVQCCLCVSRGGDPTRCCF